MRLNPDFYPGLWSFPVDGITLPRFDAVDRARNAVEERQAEIQSEPRGLSFVPATLEDSQ